MKRSVFILIGMFIGHLAFAGAPSTPPKLGDTVISEQSYSTSSSAGTSKEVSRKDHKHGNPPLPTSAQIISQMGYMPVSGISGSSTINEVDFSCAAGSSPTCTIARIAPVPVLSGGTGTNHLQFQYITGCVSRVVSSVTGTTGRTTLFSCTIPGGVVGPTDALHIAGLSSRSTTTWNKTMRLVWDNNVIFSTVRTTSGSVPIKREIVNLNSESVQVTGANNSEFDAATAAATSEFNINTALDTILLIDCQLAYVGDNCDLKYLSVWRQGP